MADTEPKKRVRRTKEEAQRVILDAAEERLANGGPEALRLQDIAADVGISHPAILHHFEAVTGWCWRFPCAPSQICAKA